MSQGFENRYNALHSAVEILEEYYQYREKRKSSGMEYKGYESWLSETFRDAKSKLQYEIDHYGG